MGCVFLLTLFSTVTIQSIVHAMRTISGGTWIPIASISGLGSDLPLGIEVCGEKLVVWKDGNTNNFSVMSDICSHRQAPLSQGRVDPLTQCIECPYHGIQFNSIGMCTKIPQLEEGTSIPSAANIASYPTKTTGDMLWAQINLPVGENQQQFSTAPDVQFPILHNVTQFTTRDLPYSLDYLLENFMDPSHIPFAHHSLQGVREDGSPIPMSLHAEGENMVEVAFRDKIRGKEREGIASFVSPLYYHFRIKQKIGLMRIMLLALCVPVKPGWSRIHLAISPGVQLPLPKFLLHSFSNKFLDTDIWVHDQERVGRGHGNSLLPVRSRSAGLDGYVMPTSSDIGVKAFRSFYDRKLKQNLIFGEQPSGALPDLSTEAQLDRWTNHARYCITCRNTLLNAQRIKKVFPIVSLLIIVATAKIWVRVGAVIFAAIVDQLCTMTIRGVEGPTRGSKTSAARM